MFGFKHVGDRGGLGRRVPESDAHIRKHSLAAPLTAFTVEHTMTLPRWHWTHDQGQQGACVGHGTAMERAIRELYERKMRGNFPQTVRFDPWWFWDRAKEVDEWADTNPGDNDGTSVHAAYDIVRRYGAKRWVPTLYNRSYADSAHDAGDSLWTVNSNQWATTVDQMRECIARNQPITIGVNWYSAFDRPLQRSDGYYLPAASLGSVEGGHSVCIYGASDRRQAFRMKNSWGRYYPLVWVPYATMQRLLNEDGEATVVVDAD